MDSLKNIHNDSVLRFGPYVLDVRQRQVMQGDKTLRVGSRALDILQVLIGQAGSIVSKNSLIAQVWPDSIVEDINLRVQVAALRRALKDGQKGQRFIETVPLRGYCFVARVEQVEANPQINAPKHNLPARLTSVIGRDEVVGRIVRQLPGVRLMTLVGPGGIGKTTVACRVAESLLRHYPDGAWLIDFSVLDDPQQVAGQMASALGLGRDSSLADLASTLAGRRALLIFDGCEHQLENSRRWAETLLPACAHLSILVTSRQALQARGESVLGLPALTIASAGTRDAMACSAMQLFVRRAQASRQGFVLRKQDVATVADICRRLDGIPLAIELAAARIDVFGLAGLPAQLDKGVHLPGFGRRTSVVRHQTFKASLDWSFERLSLHEQIVLQRIAVFGSAFTKSAAIAVCSCVSLPAEGIAKALEQLVDKSLLSISQGGGTLRYDLLRTTRFYALEKLQASGDGRVYEARLARYLGMERFAVARAPSPQLIE
ncbi:winged helix-turn-helix domain-containing protein [Pseudomonas cichorii]|uniref:ATP-binding protein n=1 Tax=Pseudomonas cichorii TaxID=36746 RepID=UPI001C893D98|nr:winged helix-turn-helix domain-containing protein [Pseudomonas cichorii]MBX8495634.1 helix-turn-helix transcriptional regulator [Pseudomonas cichorii]